MSDIERNELDAFISFFSKFPLDHAITTVSDLNDGTALFQILSHIDADFFCQPARPAATPTDNWVLRFSALKRLYRLMTQYFNDELHQPVTQLEVPDLQKMAKEINIPATLSMCRMTIVIGVHSENKEQFIGKIQELSQGEQHSLMKAIEQVMSKLTNAEEAADGAFTADDHYYRIQSDRSQMFSQKETIEKLYQNLLEEHRTLQTSYDDTLNEKEDALARLRDNERQAEFKRNEKADIHLRGENDRLRSELQKSEENLSATETALEKQMAVNADLAKNIDEMQLMTDEIAKLKDQVDEYRHAADKLQKTENVMEKYKKKLQESADLRQHVKSLEKQNADLVDKNASLEEEYRKVSGFKPLMESYKSQLAEHETARSARQKEIDTLNFDLQQAKTQLRIAQEEKKKDAETLDLYQERVRELELTGGQGVVKKAPATEVKKVDVDDADTNGDAGAVSDPVEDPVDEEEELLTDPAAQGLGSELDDAVSGTTMTDLKLQIRKLNRDLEARRKNEADGSRVLVLENLLEDANKMKSRYESDYLAAHREKLVLLRDLEEIRSGKSMGDGAEAAIALRQRLNETVDQLDALRKEHTELEVKFSTLDRELTIAKSDLTLVNKDQLDILGTLRESVNEDKVVLEADVDRLRKQTKELGDKNRMQLEQINALLLEKVSLQTDGIGQREQMLLRERAFGDLRASIGGKDIPEDIKAKMLALHEDNLTLKESYKTAQEKLLKAKTFIKSQDKLFKEEQSKSGGGLPQGSFGEDEGRIKILEEEVARKERIIFDNLKQYKKEQELMLGYIHSESMRNVRSQLAVPQHQQGRSSWLGQQRHHIGMRR
ncbi:HOOK protein-domain-containing protein [Pterulicium gracile]|uniref:HOOK protein-domain-containing protein n=1 Tax=Pterulicium gracile TaxID=1884261 RepID=A0A5C3QD45_9AGAR|nr:HOOK protein-domain-containing protein [Pterula gracilis]